MSDGITFDRGEVLTREGLVSTRLTARAGRLWLGDTPPGRRVDVSGLWLLPGMVDLHGDGFERHLAPRRGMVTDLARGLEMVEADLALNGVTTAWLAQFWSWEGGMRAPGFARRLAAAMIARQGQSRLDMRLQLRFETHMLKDYDALQAFVAAQGIGYLVFNDHLPHQRLELGKTPPRLTGSALKAGRSPEAHLAEMLRLHGQASSVRAALPGLARALAGSGVRLGSHDDPDGQTRTAYGDLGVGISEFPTSHAAAKAAKARGDAVIMGAPNVVRGGSHNKGVSAEALIAEGLVDALASDYHYPALLDAVFALVDRGVCDFGAAWRLVSEGPAQVLGLSDRGRLAAGMRADVICLDPVRRRVLGVFASGAPVLLTGSLARTALAD